MEKIQFTYIMEELKKSVNKANQFEKDMNKYFDIDLTPFMQLDALIYTLQIIFKDLENGLIDYWVYELNCGEIQEIIEFDNKKVFLFSIDDLYQLLIGEPNYV